MNNKQFLTHFIVWVPGFLPCKPFILFYYFRPLAFTRSTLFYPVNCYFQCFLGGPAQLGVVSGRLTGILFHGRLWLQCLKDSGPCCGASCLLGQGDLCPSLRSRIRTPLGAAAHPPTEGVSSSFQLSVPGCVFSVAGAGCLWLIVYLCIMRLDMCVKVLVYVCDLIEEAGQRSETLSWGKRPSQGSFTALFWGS